MGVLLLTCIALAQPGTPAQGGPRDLLRLLGIDDGHFSKFQDGAASSPEEEEVVAQLLHTMRRIEPVYWQRWTKKSPDLDTTVPLPAAFRGTCFHLSGHVTKVTLERPPPKLAGRLELDYFYRCECRVGPRDDSAVVLALRVPETWPLDRELKEPISFHGLFLKRTGAENAAMVLAAPRVEWHPPTLAGQHGVDVGLLDGVFHHAAIGAGEDRDCFYQLLSATGRISSAEMNQAAEDGLRRLDASGQLPKPQRPSPQSVEQFPVPLLFDHTQEEERLRRGRRELVELRESSWRLGRLRQQRRTTTDAQLLAMMDQEIAQAVAEFQAKAQRLKVPQQMFQRIAEADAPEAERWLELQLEENRSQRAELRQSPVAQGQPMVFEGIARQAVRVRVDDPVIRERFGLDHYYEVMVFVSGNFVIKDSGRNLGSVPIKCCLRSWPPEMPLGESISEHVRVTGVFFNVWPFSSALSAELGPGQRQFAPLLVGREPIWYPAEPRAATWHAYVAIGLLLALVLCIVFWHWLTRRGDRKFREQTMGRRREPPREGSLDDLKLE
jgi:hypothetical protein